MVKHHGLPRCCGMAHAAFGLRGDMVDGLNRNFWTTATVTVEAFSQHLAMVHPYRGYKGRRGVAGIAFVGGRNVAGALHGG